MSEGATAALGIGGLLRTTLRLTGEGFGRMFPAAFAVSLVSAGLAAWFAPTDPLPGLRPDLIWAALADLLLGTLLTGVLCLVAIDVAILRRHSLEQYLRQAARHLLPLLIFTLAISIAIGIGIVFLVVPGLYAAARYLPYAATTVFEDAGWQGITRAEALTRGYRWPLAGLLAVFLLLIVLVGIPAGVLTGELGPVPAFLSEVFFAAFSYLLGAAFTASVYLRLRELRDGLSAEEIAASLD